LQSCFVIDDIHKKFVLMEAGKLHRNFRTDLTRYHLRCKKTGNIIQHPPKDYKDWISIDDWKEFITQRGSKAFLVMILACIKCLTYCL